MPERLLRSHVALDRACALSQRRRDALGGLEVHIREHDRRAAGVQGPGDRLAQTLRRSGDDRGAPLQRYFRFLGACRTFCPFTGTILQFLICETTMLFTPSPEWFTRL